jgi:thiol-disulfide isomerase/thioredoxin
MTTPSPTPRNSLIKVLLPVAAILLLVICVLSLIKLKMGSESANTPEPNTIAVGKVIPDFSLVPLIGEKPVLASSLPSKVTLVNFWATWCEACMVEMPSIIKLRKTYRNQGFDVAAVNVDDHPEAVVPPVMKKLGFDFGVYIDRNQKLSDLFDIHAIPLSFVMDKNLKILFIETGERDWGSDESRKLLEGWLKS